MGVGDALRGSRSGWGRRTCGRCAREGGPRRYPARASWPEDLYSERLSVQSESLGNFEAPVRVADWLDEHFDVVWIAVKAGARIGTCTIAPEVLVDGVLVPLLSGVDHVRRLRDRYGAERVLPGTISVEAERAGPGRVRHLSEFADVQLAPNLATRERTETLCEELRDAGMGCEVQDDETTMLWSKLCFLAPFALATTASEARSGLSGLTRACGHAWSSALMRSVPLG